jgi:hypothetical protein
MVVVDIPNGILAGVVQCGAHYLLSCVGLVLYCIVLFLFVSMVIKFYFTIHLI